MQRQNLDNQKISQYNKLIKIVWYIFLFYLIVHLFWSITMPQWVTIPLQIDELNTGEWVVSEQESYELTVKRGELQVRVNADVTHRIFYFNALLNLLFLSSIGYIIYQAKSISEAIFLNRHFSKINSIRLRNIGRTIGITAILYPMLQRFINSIAIKHINVPNIIFDDRLPINWNYYFIGILILVIAKAFERGFELQEENALTV